MAITWVKQEDPISLVNFDILKDWLLQLCILQSYGRRFAPCRITGGATTLIDHITAFLREYDMIFNNVKYCTVRRLSSIRVLPLIWTFSHCIRIVKKTPGSLPGLSSQTRDDATNRVFASTLTTALPKLHYHMVLRWLIISELPRVDPIVVSSDSGLSCTALWLSVCTRTSERKSEHPISMLVAAPRRNRPLDMCLGAIQGEGSSARPAAHLGKLPLPKCKRYQEGWNAPLHGFIVKQALSDYVHITSQHQWLKDTTSPNALSQGAWLSQQEPGYQE